MDLLSAINQKWLSILLKIGAVLLLLGILYVQVFARDDFSELIAVFIQQLSLKSIFLCCITLLLMLLNWSIETLKWQQLINCIERLSFVQAFKAIVCGISLSLFTPNRVGEYGGRVLLLQKADKLQGVAITLVGSLAQLIANMTTGVVGFALFCAVYLPINKYLFNSLIILACIALLMGLYGYFHLHYLRFFAKKMNTQKLQKLIDCLHIVGTFDKSLLLRVLLLSALRNMTYTIQYWLLLQALGISLSFSTAFVLISSIFFVQTLVPSIALVELGVRGNVALFFIGYVSQNYIAIIATTFSLWIINLMLPALLGLMVVSQLNLGQYFRKSKMLMTTKTKET